MINNLPRTCAVVTAKIKNELYECALEPFLEAHNQAGLADKQNSHFYLCQLDQY